MSLLNKVALITGAGSGIGAAIATKLSAEGALVAIVGFEKSKLEAVAEKCNRNQNKSLVIEGDLTKEEFVSKVVKETVDKFGKIDVLVNNAGVGQAYPSILSSKALQDYDYVMNINIRTIVNMTNLVAPHLITSKGNIINISSSAGLRPFLATGFAYNTSKAAVDHFTRSVALELAPKGVRVNGINPGPTSTNIFKNGGYDSVLEEKAWKIMKKATALGRIGDPEEVADMALFLASDKARGITGASFSVDNGNVLKH
ncbi:enoyl-(Acyl carrier protein) reductase domain-containing protein [Phthorimaea operculella]|nr:enoyl-(Acyl carrier protein) reductase domain-containing protein [Phthorimaea operculella]